MDDVEQVEPGAAGVPAESAPAESQVASEAPAGDTPAASDSHADSPPADDGPLTVAQAFAQAKASQQAADDSAEGSGDSQDSQDASNQPPDSEAATPDANAEPSRTEGPVTTQGVLRRIQSLVDQGRINELTAEERGVYARIQSKGVEAHQAEQQRETEFRDMYVDLLRMEEEEPERYIAKMKAEPGYLTFQKAYERAHPEVTLDNPDIAPPKVDPAKVRSEAIAEYEATVVSALTEVAQANGVTAAKFDEIKKSAKGQASLMNAIVAEAINARIETGIAERLPAIQKAEREAAEKAAQVSAIKPARVPVAVNGTAPSPGSNGNEKDGPISMRDAFAAARESVGI